MSPFITFNSSGNSSNDVLLKNEPNLVKRASSGNNSPSLPLSSVIVRNFMIANGFLFSPLRICLKKIGFPILILTSKQRTIKTGLITTNKQNADRKSKHLLKHLNIIFLIYLISLISVNASAAITFTVAPLNFAKASIALRDRAAGKSAS